MTKEKKVTSKGPSNGDRLTALEKGVSDILGILGTKGGAANASADFVFLDQQQTAPAGQPITVVVPKPDPPPPPPKPIDWAPILTAGLGFLGSILPTLMKRPDPVEQLAGLMTVMAEAREVEGAGGMQGLAELVAASGPMLAMLKAAPAAAAGGTGTDAKDLLTSLGIDPATASAFLARQAGADGQAGPS